MSYLRFAVPGLLLVYFLLQARENIAATAALPLLLYFGRSAFIDTTVWQSRLGPIPIYIDDVIFLGLAIAWLYVCQKRPCARGRPGGAIAGMMLGYLALIVVEVAATWLRGYRLVRVVQPARFWAYVPLGYLMWVDLFRRVTRDEAWGLIHTLAAASAGLMVLYSLSALGVSIYPYEAFYVTSVGGSTLVRDFLTLTPFAHLALAFYLAQGTKDVRSLAAIAVITIGLLLTFTRSWVLPAAACLGLAALSGERREKPARNLARMALLVAAVATGLVTLQAIAPQALALLVGRLQDAQSYGLADRNLLARFDVLQAMSQGAAATSQWLGAGMVDYGLADPSGSIYSRQWILGDIMWSKVVLYLGYLGVALLGLLLLAALWESLRAMAADKGNAQRMGLLTLLAMVPMAVVTFTGEGFLAAGGVAGLTFALITAERSGLWSVDPVTVPGIPIMMGLSSSWFTRQDQLWWLRRLALFTLVAAVEYYVLRRFIGL